MNKIAVPAPASTLSESISKKVTAELRAHFDADILLGEDCWDRKAASNRAEIFLGYALDDSIDVILAYRGGEGSADLIPFLDKHRHKLKQAKPKVLSGMSDVTALLFYFYQVIGWPVVHGLVATHFTKKILPEVLADFKLAIHNGVLLCGSKVKHIASPLARGLRPLNDCANNTKELSGNAIAGNLTLLQLGIKDIWEFNAEQKILFLEDWHEKGYSVWRSLKYLDRIGKFKDIKALVFGDFCCAPIMSDPKADHAQKCYLQQCLEGFARECDFPVYQTAWFGHGEKNQSILFSGMLLR